MPPGSDYRQLTDQLLIADAGAGAITSLMDHSHVKTVLGTGFNAPSDIELSTDGIHAYVTENPSALLRLNLTNLNRSAATVVASGFNGIDQVALDETHGYAYVTEFAAGQSQRVSPSTHCAQSFFLYASDRVINGRGFIHGPAGYQKSITIML